MRFISVFFVLFGILVAQQTAIAQVTNEPAYVPRQQLKTLRSHYALENRRLELGFRAGTSYGLTELSGSPSINTSFFLWDTRWEVVNQQYGAFMRYRFGTWLGSSMAFNYGKVSGDYRLYEPGNVQYAFGTIFQNHVYELSLTMNVYLPRIDLDLPLDMLLYLGVAGFRHEPRLSGPIQYRDGPMTDLAIPLGYTLMYTMGNRYRLSGDIGWRKTFTDLMDGIESGQGNDSYFFISLGLSYLFPSRQSTALRFVSFKDVF